MAGVRSLLLLLLVTWLELTDCQLFYLLTYIFVSYALRMAGVRSLLLLLLVTWLELTDCQ